MDKNKCLEKLENIKLLLEDAGIEDIYCGNKDSSKEINLLIVAVDQFRDIVKELIETS